MKDEVVNILLINIPHLKSRQAVGKFFKCVSASDNYLNYVKEFDCLKVMKMGLKQFWI